MYSRVDYYQTVGDPVGKALLARYDARYPGAGMVTTGSASTGMCRGLKLREPAVKEAAWLEQEEGVNALDHAKITEGPGGTAEMVSGEQHVRVRMHIAQARNGGYEVAKSRGAIDPQGRPQALEQSGRVRAGEAAPGFGPAASLAVPREELGCLGSCAVCLRQSPAVRANVRGFRVPIAGCPCPSRALSGNCATQERHEWALCRPHGGYSRFS